VFLSTQFTENKALYKIGGICMKKPNFRFFSITILSVLLVAGCGEESGGGGESGGGESRVFKLGHIGAESHIWTPTSEVLKEELEERSDGRLSLEVYPNATLGNEPDLLEQLQGGSLDMAWITSAELTNRSDSFNAWFMPFLLKDAQHVYDLAESDEGKAILATLTQDQGVHPLGYSFVETRNLLMRESLITNAEDISGKKIRVIPSPIVIEWWKKLGASPTPIPLAEIYTSLQQGVIDGIEIGPMALMSSKFNEISENYTLTNHHILTAAGLFSQSVWDELSEEDQKIITESFEAARQANLELAKEGETKNLEDFKAEGGKVAEIENMDALLDKAEQFQNEYTSQDENIKAFVEKAKELSSE
jgi:tripartite ATP-independent transporter DctP family solute receptor